MATALRFALFLVIFVAACGGGSEAASETRDAASDRDDASETSACVDPAFPAADPCASLPTDVHFAADVKPILAGCSGENCHDGTWASSSPWPSLVGPVDDECCVAHPLITPGKPAESYLLAKLRSPGCLGDMMPPGGKPLNSAAIHKIEAWICAGAKDD